MTHYDRIMSVYRRKNNDSIPWAAYGGFLLPSGENERRLRNSGCGWIQWTPVCSWLAPGMSHMTGWMFESEIRNVETSLRFAWDADGRAILRTYTTPVGTIHEELRQEPGYHSLWVKKFFIESREDYRVMQYIVENTVFRPNYEAFIEARDNLGTDGLQLAVVDRSPFQKTLIELCGTERLYFDFLDMPDVVEDLLEALALKQDEAYRIVAESPAEVVWMVDNVTGDITEPRMFEKYSVPFYNKQARLLHDAGKLLAIHFDGHMRPLKDLIARVDVDVVESFTLPEMGGDLPIKEAYAAWPDKAVVANIPACFCHLDREGILNWLEAFFAELPSRNFMFELSENFPPAELRRVLPVFAEFMSQQ